MPVRMVVAARHVEFGRADPTAPRLLEGEGGARPERSQSLGEGIGRRAGVGQGAHQHVAADSRECVQVADLHGVSFHYRLPAPTPGGSAP